MKNLPIVIFVFVLSVSSISMAQPVDTAWVRNFAPGFLSSSDAATDIAVDNSGNVYVTGRSKKSDSEFEYTAIKYNVAGVEQWVVRGGYTIAIDNVGNVYLSGGYRGTIKYNSSGIEQWSIPEGGSTVIYKSDYIYINHFVEETGTYEIIKYHATGIEQWRIPGHGYLFIDDSGNVYTAGADSAIIYNSEGNRQSAIIFSGPTSGANWVRMDKSGNFYRAAGHMTGQWPDYGIVKNNRFGVERWFVWYDGPVSLRDYMHDFAVDKDGNVYATGMSATSGTQQQSNYDFATVKYDTSGIEQWVVRYNGPGNRTDWPEEIFVDDSGNVYITGMSSTTTSDDYTTIKYNPDGVEQWVARYDRPVNGDDEARTLTVDSSGNVYVTGVSTSSVTDGDYVTIKYNSSGVEQWVSIYTGTSHDDGEFEDLVMDDTGYIYVTGSI